MKLFLFWMKNNGSSKQDARKRCSPFFCPFKRRDVAKRVQILTRILTFALPSPYLKSRFGQRGGFSCFQSVFALTFAPVIPTGSDVTVQRVKV